MTRRAFLQNSTLTFPAALVLGGCATTDGSSGVDVTLVNVEPASSGGGLGEASIAFVVRIENASPEALHVEGGAHKLYLNGVYVGQGLSNRHFDVAGLSTATDRVEVHLSTIRLATSLLAILKAEQLTYRLDSIIYGMKGTATKLREFKAHREGTVRMSDFSTPTTAPAK